MIFLPEAFDYIEEDKAKSFKLAESLNGPTITNYKLLAKSLGVWLSLGGFHEKVISIILKFKNIYILVFLIHKNNKNSNLLVYLIQNNV